MFRTLLLLLVAVLGAHATVARAETTRCTVITALPTTITTPGTYCFKSHLHTSITSGTAVAIGASDVTLDCNGFDVGGTNGGPSTQAIGVRATNRKRVTVRGCNVRAFRTGIQLSGADSVIEDNNVLASTFQGMELALEYSVVRRNRILNTGAASATAAYGIRQTSGRSGLISDNLISGVASAGQTRGIESLNKLAVIEDNRILDLVGTDVIGILGGHGNDFFRHNYIQAPVGEYAIRSLVYSPDDEYSFCGDNAYIGFDGVDCGGAYNYKPGP